MIEQNELEYNFLANIELEEKEARYSDPEMKEIDVENLPIVYKESIFLQKLQTIGEQPRTVLSTDIDGTFYHPDYLVESRKLKQALDKSNIPLVYCTGRGIEGVTGHKDLPPADLTITCVGTALWVRTKEGDLELDQQYQDYLAELWDTKKVYNILVDFVAKNPSAEFQPVYQPSGPEPPEKLAEGYKISLNYYGSREEAENAAENLRELLGENYAVILSTNWREESCYYVDILPQRDGLMGKSLPIAYLKKIFNNFRSIVAGDGGNDSEMLFRSGSQAIIVGNRMTELEQMLNDMDKTPWRKNLVEQNFGGERNDIYVGEENEIGPRAIINALVRGDFNPKIAPIIANNLQE